MSENKLTADRNEAGCDTAVQSNCLQARIGRIPIVGSNSEDQSTVIYMQRPHIILTKLSGLLSYKEEEVRKVVKTILRVFVYSSNHYSDFSNEKKQRRLIKSAQSLVDALERYFARDETCQPAVKYFHDQFLARVIEDVNPYPKDDRFESDKIYTGYMLRLIRRKISSRKTSFLYSLQKGAKQAWPELPSSYAAKSFQDHYKNMIRCNNDPSEDVLASISRVSQEIFDRISEKDMQKCSPSISACLQRNRKQGGCKSLFPSARKCERSDPIGYAHQIHSSILKYRENVFNVCQRYIAETNVRDLLKSKVAIIPEPGKFRIITKGDGYLYTALQPLQGALLGAWKKDRSSTFRDEDLTERVRALDDPELSYWASVDYKSATDTLSLEASLRALRGVSHLDCYPTGLISLMGGSVEYPKIASKDKKQVLSDPFSCVRTSGQLMGHPLSFPLLCTINKSVWRFALDMWRSPLCLSHEERKFRGRKAREIRNQVIVNGDDMLAKVTLELYDCLMASARMHGFSLSAGKNYCSPHSAMINSQIFVKTEDGMKRRGYLNQRIISGFSPKSGESRATPIQIAQELNKMVALNPVYSSAVYESLSRFTVKFLNSPVNWFLPVHLGGFGLQPRHGQTFEVTRKQRLLAAHFINHTDISLFKSSLKKRPGRILFPGLLTRKRLLLKDEQCQDNEVSSPPEDWEERLETFEHVSNDEILGQEYFKISRIRRDFRLSPVKLNTLLDYWELRQCFQQCSPCPPLMRTKVPSLIFN